VYGGLIFGYLFLLLRRMDDWEHRASMGLGVLARMVLVVFLPQFSDDFWRFLWDGRLLMHGVNPFDFTPTQALEQGLAPESWRSVYAPLNSKEYFSVYPPALQVWFGLAAWLSGGSVVAQVIILKVGVVLAELATLFFLDRLVRHFQLPRKAVLLYALNPLVISELSGNLHFEAWMVCFTLGALWMLTQGNLWAGALFLALAVGSKLLPLMFVPFLLPRLGWRKMLVFCGLLGVFLLILFLPFVTLERWRHISESLRLYFRYFEFNPGPQAWLRNWAGEENKELFLTRFPQAVGLLLLGGMVLDRNRDWVRLAGSWLIALGFYQLTSSTVHPWYLAPLVALAALSGYRWPMVWSVWLLFTYWFYYLPGFQPPRAFLLAEYLTVIPLALVEWMFTARGQTLERLLWRTKVFRRMFRATLPARLRIKEGRIAALLGPGQSLVDIGAGNGGLAHALMGRGHPVTAVDVKDISFFEDVKPIVYDGKRLPFADRSFDVALLITVLHHTPDPDAILAEAKRVGRRVVVMEDIYRNSVQERLTHFTDSLVNLEFHGHPHTNRTDAGWREAFARLGLRVTHEERFRTLLFFTQVIYVLEREE
jgi:alpha-1,6-mannosyltransferase